jgi:hypothetical protein
MVHVATINLDDGHVIERNMPHGYLIKYSLMPSELENIKKCLNDSFDRESKTKVE